VLNHLFLATHPSVLKSPSTVVDGLVSSVGYTLGKEYMSPGYTCSGVIKLNFTTQHITLNKN